MKRIKENEKGNKISEKSVKTSKHQKLTNYLRNDNAILIYTKR